MTNKKHKVSLECQTANVTVHPHILLTVNHQPFSGGAVDIMKCFDQIDRQLLYALAKQTGLPQGILNVYSNYQEHMHVRSTVHGGIGAPFTDALGSPRDALCV